MSRAQEGLITRVARLEQAQRMVMLIEQDQLLEQAIELDQEEQAPAVPETVVMMVPMVK